MLLLRAEAGVERTRLLSKLYFCLQCERCGGFLVKGTATVAAFALLPIMAGLQRQGEGCDGRFVQASFGDASKFAYVQCSHSACAGSEERLLSHF